MAEFYSADAWLTPVAAATSNARPLRPSPGPGTQSLDDAIKQGTHFRQAVVCAPEVRRRAAPRPIGSARGQLR